MESLLEETAKTCKELDKTAKNQYEFVREDKSL